MCKGGGAGLPEARRRCRQQGRRLAGAAPGHRARCGDSGRLRVRMRSTRSDDLFDSVTPSCSTLLRRRTFGGVGCRESRWRVRRAARPYLKVGWSVHRPARQASPCRVEIVRYRHGKRRVNAREWRSSQSAVASRESASRPRVAARCATPEIPRFRDAKFAIDGKTYGRSAGVTPNHVASVAPY